LVCKGGLKRAILSAGTPAKLAEVLSKSGPVAVAAVTTALTYALGLADQRVAIFGAVR